MSTQQISSTAASGAGAGPRPCQIDISVAFPEFGVKGIPLDGYDAPTPGYTPERTAGYRFRKDTFRELNAFATSQFYWAAKLEGEKGCGKTSAVREYCARLNIPLVMVPCHGDMKMPQLMGHYVPSESGGMEFDPGPVTLAAASGWWLVLDEYNTLDPEVSVGLNPILEGNAQYFKELRQTVKPAPGTKFLACVNPRRQNGLYAGRKKQDGANSERFFNIQVSYPSPEDEIPLLVAEFESAGMDDDSAMDQATRFSKVAERVRAAYISATTGDGDVQISNVISTRSLLGWAELTTLYGGLEQKGISPIHFALERALTGTSEVSPETKEAIHQIVEDEFGQGYYLAPQT